MSFLCLSLFNFNYQVHPISQLTVSLRSFWPQDSLVRSQRHIDIGYYWMNERVSNVETVVKHMGTADMHANMPTKPLQGQQFVNEREALTGWEKRFG
jgi:hypothetical protein